MKVTINSSICVETKKTSIEDAVQCEKNVQQKDQMKWCFIQFACLNSNKKRDLIWDFPILLVSFDFRLFFFIFILSLNLFIIRLGHRFRVNPKKKTNKQTQIPFVNNSKGEAKTWFLITSLEVFDSYLLMFIYVSLLACKLCVHQTQHKKKKKIYYGLFFWSPKTRNKEKNQ